MTMWNAEGREADAEREEQEARKKHRRSEPIDVKRFADFPDEPHWVIMTFGGRGTYLSYAAYLDRNTFERALKSLAGQVDIKAFHVDSIAKITVEVKI